MMAKGSRCIAKSKVVEGRNLINSLYSGRKKPVSASKSNLGKKNDHRKVLSCMRCKGLVVLKVEEALLGGTLFRK